MRIDRWMGAVCLSVFVLACESAPAEELDGGGIDAAILAFPDAAFPAFPDAHFDLPDTYVNYENVEGAEYFVRFDADGRARGFAAERFQYYQALAGYSGGAGDACAVAVGASFERASVGGIFGSGPNRGSFAIFSHTLYPCENPRSEVFPGGEGEMEWTAERNYEREGVVIQHVDTDGAIWRSRAEQPAEQRFVVTDAYLTTISGTEVVIWEGTFDATLEADDGRTMELRGGTFHIALKTSR